MKARYFSKFISIAVPLLVIASYPTTAVAHAFGGRYDLPLPLWLNLAGAGIAVGLSFIFIAVLGRSSPVLPDSLGRDNIATQLGEKHPPLVGYVSTAIFGFLIVAGIIGNQSDPFSNILPVSVWILWWAGLAYVSAVIGDVWHFINPLPVIARMIGALWMTFAGRRLVTKKTMPTWIGLWPAVLAFMAFGWAELIWQGNTVPRDLALAILIYTGITGAGMARYGVAPWTARADCFACFFHLFSLAAPFDLRSRRFRGLGRGLMNDAPGAMEAGDRGERSAIAFVMVALAIVAFDGIRETPFWLSVRIAMLDVYYTNSLDQLIGEAVAGKIIHSTGLFALPLIFYAIFMVTCRLMATAGAGNDRGNTERLPTILVARCFVLALVPIAIAYHLAHYLTYLLIWGQSIIPLISDPFGFGWNVFGTAGIKPDIAIVGPRFAWISSVIAIVAGHIAALVVGHRMSMVVFGDRKRAMRSQLPMLALMIAYTMLSLWILAQPIVEF